MLVAVLVFSNGHICCFGSPLANDHSVVQVWGWVCTKGVFLWMLSGVTFLVDSCFWLSFLLRLLSNASGLHIRLSRMMQTPSRLPCVLEETAASHLKPPNFKEHGRIRGVWWDEAAFVETKSVWSVRLQISEVPERAKKKKKDTFPTEKFFQVRHIRMNEVSFWQFWTPRCNFTSRDRVVIYLMCTFILFEKRSSKSVTLKVKVRLYYLLNQQTSGSQTCLKRIINCYRAAEKTAHIHTFSNTSWVCILFHLNKHTHQTRITHRLQHIHTLMRR